MRGPNVSRMSRSDGSSVCQFGLEPMAMRGRQEGKLDRGQYWRQKESHNPGWCGPQSQAYITSEGLGHSRTTRIIQSRVDASSAKNTRWGREAPRLRLRSTADGQEGGNATTLLPCRSLGNPWPSYWYCVQLVAGWREGKRDGTNQSPRLGDGPLSGLKGWMGAGATASTAPSTTPGRRVENRHPLAAAGAFDAAVIQLPRTTP